MSVPIRYATSPTEDQLCIDLANWLHDKHPELDGLWHFDYGSGTKLSHKQAMMQSRLNQRGWPDFFLAVTMSWTPTSVYGAITYHGLFLELKRDGTRLKKTSGIWTSDHITEQADQLGRLVDAGYAAQFAVGLEQAQVAIQSYLGVDPEPVTGETF